MCWRSGEDCCTSPRTNSSWNWTTSRKSSDTAKNSTMNSCERNVSFHSANKLSEFLAVVSFSSIIRPSEMNESYTGSLWSLRQDWSDDDLRNNQSWDWHIHVRQCRWFTERKSGLDPFIFAAVACNVYFSVTDVAWFPLETHWYDKFRPSDGVLDELLSMKLFLTGFQCSRWIRIAFRKVFRSHDWLLALTKRLFPMLWSVCSSPSTSGKGTFLRTTERWIISVDQKIWARSQSRSTNSCDSKSWRKSYPTISLQRRWRSEIESIQWSIPTKCVCGRNIRWFSPV